MSLELREVTKQENALTHIYPTSVKFKSGIFNVLLGPTLSGKTTLMRLMAGLETPSSGEVWFDDNNVTGIAVQKRNVAMVYQQFINYPNLNVFNNIASPLKLKKLGKDKIQQRVGDVAELLGLAPMLNRMTQELSGGQQQRVALARALVKQADLILLDEPLANLDYKLREELREELPKLFTYSNSTVVYATTEPSEALLLGGYTATLHQGNITQYGPTHEVYHLPDNLKSAIEFSDPPLNILKLKKQGDSLIGSTNKWPTGERFKTLADNDYYLAFRPHHLLLEQTDSDVFSFNGQVELTEINGSETLLHMLVNQQRWVSQLHGIHKFDEGEQIPLSVDPQQCFVFNLDGQRVITH